MCFSRFQKSRLSRKKASREEKSFLMKSEMIEKSFWTKSEMIEKSFWTKSEMIEKSFWAKSENKTTYLIYFNGIAD